VKKGEPLLVLNRQVIGDTNNKVYQNDLIDFKPGIGSGIIASTNTSARNQAIYIDDNMYQADINQAHEEDRLYRFLDWQPYIPTAGLRVTGDMEILAKYYKADDVFTNYFLNKLTTCTLSDEITVLPAGAFLHNSNLTKLTTKATLIGKGSFSYFSNNRKIFIFTNTNVSFDAWCFYNLNNSIVIFTGTGSISVNNKCFDNVTNCNIIVLNSDEPIHASSSIYDTFSNFYTTSTNKNYLFVTPNAYSRYQTNNVSDNIPTNLLVSELAPIQRIENNNIDDLLEEADLL